VSDPGQSGKTAAVIFGGAAAFVVGVQIVRAIRPALLLDPDPRWLVERFVLWILLTSVVAAAGGIAAAAFLWWNRSPVGNAEPGPLPLRRGTIAIVCGAALLAGLLLRLVWIETLPIPFLGDEISLIGPSLALTGQWSDFANSIRPVPYGASDAHEMIGVLYLRMFRESLGFFGATVLGVRFISFVGGALSLVTATLLGRALLPEGGAALTAVVLAGLRWHLILSRFGWHSVVLLPLVDLATLAVIVSRRRRRPAFAALAGALLGLGAHFYLAVWIAGAAILGFCAWPDRQPDSVRSRAQRLAFCAAGFLLVAAPLFLFREGRSAGYFGRASRHSVITEIRYSRSLLPPFAVAAESLVAPWLIPDPEAWHDLPGRSRLGWIIGIPVAAAFARALAAPREELSGLLLVQAGAALMGAVSGGQAGHPNGFRFGYLTTLTAVAAASGFLQIVRSVPAAGRRAAAVAVIGLAAVSGVVGARDAVLRWPEHRDTFLSFGGEDTLIGRAAARWEMYGVVRIASGLARSDANIDIVRRYRLSPPGGAGPADPMPRASRVFRVAGPRSPLGEGERRVEIVRDGFGRDWAVVFGRLRSRA
jgi:hypothetical protein